MIDPRGALSDYERKVYEVLAAHSPKPVSYAHICAETLIDPDILLHVIVALVQKRFAELGPNTKIEDLELLAKQAPGVAAAGI